MVAPNIFSFFDVCCVNAFILAKLVGYNQPLKDFKLELISNLINNKNINKVPKTVIEKKKNKPFVSPSIRQQGASHQPVRTTLRRFAFCSKKGHQRRTVWECSTCSVPLCLSKTKSCFNNFHMQ